MAILLKNTGAIFMFIALAMEFLGALALVSYSIRRRLSPIVSPMNLLGVGPAVFVAGNIVMAIGAALARSR